MKKQKYSEACRPMLGKQTDRTVGKLIDVLAVFALLARTATTFSVATPLLRGIKGISWLANACTILFGILLLFGG